MAIHENSKQYVIETPVYETMFMCTTFLLNSLAGV